MDTAEREILARHLEAEARHDAVAAADCYVADGWYEHRALELLFEGRDAVAAQYAMTYASFPDLRFDVDDQVDDDNATVQYGTFRGTLTGPLLGLQPTGAVVSMPMVAAYSFRDGAILSERITMDLATFADQCGLDLHDLQVAAGIDTAMGRVDR